MRTFVVDVWGDLACFTRPETKVERFSYPVMTPSAARGVLDAIYAKPPEFGWRIDRIEVLKPIRFITLRRNEVKEKINANAVRRALAGAGEPPSVICDGTAETTGTDQKGRTQRQTVALRDVHYRVHAHMRVRAGLEERARALEEQAWRRINGGKCFYQPYLGCREFVAYFAPTGSAQPVVENVDVGWMIYDVFDLDRVVRDEAQPFISLFDAQVSDGILDVPPWESDKVRKPPKGA